MFRLFYNEKPAQYTKIMAQIFGVNSWTLERVDRVNVLRNNQYIDNQINNIFTIDPRLNGC
jgi:hypothetical protein